MFKELPSIIETASELDLEAEACKKRDRWLKNLFREAKPYYNCYELKELQHRYYILHQELLISEFDQTRRTHYERKVEQFIKQQTSVKYHSSFWYGPFNLDFFFPSLRCGSSQGVAIEVDGGIHNHPSKMDKDHSKYEFLKRNRIAVLSLNNNSLSNPTARQTITNLRQLQRLDTRGKRRVLKRAYSITLAWSDYEKSLRGDDNNLMKGPKV